MRLRPEPAKITHRCKACADTGLIELDGVPPANYAWQAFFTMMPCLNCKKGEHLKVDHAQGRLDYEAQWISSNGKL